MKRPFLTRFSVVLTALFFMPAIASAHPGHDSGRSLGLDFSSGFHHPLFGVDHLLAMIAVGLWAAQLGSRARWLIPATFVGVMAIGAAIAQGCDSLSFMSSTVEQLITASLLVFGLMVAWSKRLPLFVGLGLTALFAVFHGFAHGSEIPISASGYMYAIGFGVATALLHIVGLVLGKVCANEAAWFPKVAGVGVAAVGVVLLAS